MEYVPPIEADELKVRCPTCGAGPRMQCESVLGGVRSESHLDRRLIVCDSVREEDGV
jgi:hypothetical protein